MGLDQFGKSGPWHQPRLEIKSETRRLKIPVHAKYTVSPFRQQCSRVSEDHRSPYSSLVGIERRYCSDRHLIRGNGIVESKRLTVFIVGQVSSHGGDVMIRLDSSVQIVRISARKS